MVDLTKCLGTGCKDKKRCLRFTAPVSNYQSWAEFYKNHENCQHYLSMESKSMMKRKAVQK